MEESIGRFNASASPLTSPRVVQDSVEQGGGGELRDEDLVRALHEQLGWENQVPPSIQASATDTTTPYPLRAHCDAQVGLEHHGGGDDGNGELCDEDLARAFAERAELAVGEVGSSGHGKIELMPWDVSGNAAHDGVDGVGDGEGEIYGGVRHVPGRALRRTRAPQVDRTAGHDHMHDQGGEIHDQIHAGQVYHGVPHGEDQMNDAGFQHDTESYYTRLVDQHVQDVHAEIGWGRGAGGEVVWMGASDVGVRRGCTVSDKSGRKLQSRRVSYVCMCVCVDGWLTDTYIHTFTLTCVQLQYSSCRSSERDVCCAGGCCVSSSCGGTPRSLPAPRRACWTLAGQAWTKNCAKSPITRGGQCFSLLTLRAPPALPAVSFLTMTWEAWRAGRADGCVSLCAGEFSLCESQSGDECDAVNAETGCTASRSYLFSTVRVCKRLPTLTAYHAYRYTG